MNAHEYEYTISIKILDSKYIFMLFYFFFYWNKKNILKIISLIVGLIII